MSHHFDDDDYIASPRDFEDPVFAANNKEIFNRYLDLRIKGHRPHMALRMAFGNEFAEDGQLISRAFCIERNPYVVEQFPRRLEKTKEGDQWNVKTSVHELLSIVRDPIEKGNVRMAAIKELNTMAGIVIDDSDEKAKSRRGLADFYENAPTLSEQAQAAIVEAQAQGDATRH